jgi:hypothetical protein
LRLEGLDGLLAMAKKNNRRESLLALDTLKVRICHPHQGDTLTCPKELFTEYLLPDRKLHPFSKRSFARFPSHIGQFGLGSVVEMSAYS